MAVFGGALALLALRFWQLRAADLNPDEPAFIGVAWLIARGQRLYADIPWQHMPLEIILAQPLAALGWLRHPAPYRALVLLAQAAAGLGLALSPAFEGRRARGLLAGAVYLGFYAALAPDLQGHVFSAYAVAGAAWVLSLAWLALPLALGQRPPVWAAAAGAAAYAVWALSSPALAYAAVFFLLACAVAPSMDGRAWKAALAGGFGILGLELAWLLRFGGLGAWFRQAILFCLYEYPRINHEPDGTALLGAAWDSVWASRYQVGQRGTLLLLTFGLFFALAWKPRAWRQKSVPLLLALAVLALQVRLVLWKGLPAACAAYAGVALALQFLPRALLPKAERPLGLALALLALSIPLRALSHQLPAAYRPSWDGPQVLHFKAVFDQLRAKLPPDSTIAVLQARPQVYLMAGMPSAYHGVDYGPLGYHFEFPPGGAPTAGNLCEALETQRPALIFDDREGTMYFLDVSSFTPACVEAIEKASYASVPAPGWEHWWVRKDLAGALNGAEAP
jgi:hypothetical protein